MVPYVLTSLVPSSIFIGLLSFLATPAFAQQLAYQGIRQDVRYKVFIHEQKSLGGGRWKFQTKTIYSDGTNPHYSDPAIADCFNSTIDGELVRAIAQYGYQEGQSAVLLAVCGRGQR
jgi:hypothetical protein